MPTTPPIIGDMYVSRVSIIPYLHHPTINQVMLIINTDIAAVRVAIVVD